MAELLLRLFIKLIFPAFVSNKMGIGETNIKYKKLHHH